jgi:hypothetical protein
MQTGKSQDFLSDAKSLGVTTAGSRRTECRFFANAQANPHPLAASGSALRDRLNNADDEKRY